MELTSASEVLKDWVELYSDSLYSWAFYKVSSKEIAEDLVQDTFLAAVQSFDKFEAKSNPKTWLLSILNNKISDFYRASYRMPTAATSISLDYFFDQFDHWKSDEAPDEWADEQVNLLDDSAFLATLDECLRRLPANWYSAVQLKFLEEKKGEQICQELGISATNFWQILHRAKLQLRKCLEINWYNE